MNVAKTYARMNIYRVIQDWDLKKSFDALNENRTEAKVKRCAIIGLGLLVATRINPLAMLSLAGSIYVAYFLIKDYEDPKEVEKMRKKALVLDFPSLIREHGSIDQILEGKVLTHKELKGKINQAVTSAQKIHSEELPRLLQFQKQINARKDPEEKRRFSHFFTKFFS